MSNLGRGIELYLSTLTVERGLSPNTTDAYRRDLRQYLEFLSGGRGPDALPPAMGGGPDALPPVVADPTPPDLDRFVSHLHQRGLSPASVARKVAAVRGLHRFLINEGSVTDDPTRLLAPARRVDRFPKALAVDQAIKLVEAPDSSTVGGRRDRALLEFLYGTGGRVTEAVGLDLRDIDLEERTAVLTGKGNRQRIVPLGSAAISALKIWLPDRLHLSVRGADSDAVFLNLRGGRLSRVSAFRIVRFHASRVGINPHLVSPHTLRHSAATHMVEGGADLRTVQVLLGHARISTTQVYTRVSPQHLVEVFVLSHPRAR